MCKRKRIVHPTLFRYMTLCVSLSMMINVSVFSQRQLNWVGHWQDEHKRETLVYELETEFAFLNQDVDVNLEFPSEIIGSRNQFKMADYYLTLIQSGNYEWDVIWMTTRIYLHIAEKLNNPYWGREYLVDFSNIPGFIEAHKPFIAQDVTAKARYGGIHIGPFIEGYYASLFYNRDVAEKAGVQIPQFGMTFDDFVNIIRQVHQYNQTHSQRIVPIHEASDWFTLVYLFLSLTTSEINNYTNIVHSIYEPDNLKALYKTFQAFEKLSEYDPISHLHDRNIWFDTRHHILADTVLFQFNGTWMYSHWMGLDSEKARKMVPAQLPVFQPVNFCIGGYTVPWAVFKKSPNRDSAIKAVMSLCRPEVAELWIRYTKNPTALKGHVSQITKGTDPFEDYTTIMSEKYKGRVFASDDMAYMLGEENKLLRSLILDLLRDVITQKTSADAAYQEVVRNLK